MSELQRRLDAQNAAQQAHIRDMRERDAASKRLSDERASEFITMMRAKNIGNVVNAVPRMNLFFKATVPESSIKKTSHVAHWQWFTKDEFMQAWLNVQDQAKLADAIFSD